MSNDHNDDSSTPTDVDLGSITTTITMDSSSNTTDTIDTGLYNTTYTVPTYTFGDSSITLGNDEMPVVTRDINVDGQSLKEFMQNVNERLCILTPKPELLEKYDALKEAYENYKILEKLCTDDGTVYKKT